MGLAAAISFEFKMITIRCWSCGVPYGMPDYFQQRREEDHQTFYCPNGHGGHYPQDNEAEKLRKELEKSERAKQMALDSARMEATERKKTEAKLKKVSTKLKRIENGVCPQCNRTFANVARHMQTKHGVECSKPPKGSRVRDTREVTT